MSLIDLPALGQLLACGQQGHHLARQRQQRLPLVCVELAWFIIDDGKGAELLAIGCDQRRTGIGPETGLSGDERITGKPVVVVQIGNLEHAILFDGMGADRPRTGDVGQIQTDRRLEPRPLVIDQRYEGNRRSGDLRRDTGYVIEALFGLSSQDIIIGQGRQTASFTIIGAAVFAHGPPCQCESPRGDHRLIPSL
nr:hypothetical protein [Sphingomonas sp. RIT328]